MRVVNRQPKPGTLNLRLDHKLKQDFISAAGAENRPASEVPRGLMLAYVERQQRKRFETDARRQSTLIASSFDDQEVMQLFEDTWDMEGWS